MRAARVAAFVALLATPALAQPPGYQPQNYAPPTGYQPPAGQQQGMLPLPPGYRPRTPPPQTQPQSQAQPQRPTAAAGTMPGSGSGGKVMYFQKPADALTATGGPGSSAESVAQVSDTTPALVPLPVPDAPALTLPPPPPSRYLAPDQPLTAPRPSLGIPPAAPVAYGVQPTLQPEIPPGTSLKKDLKDPPGGPAVTQLPSRDKIFMVYDDAQLEQAIIERLIRDRSLDIQESIKEKKQQLMEKKQQLKDKKDPKEIAELEKQIAELEKEIPTLEMSLEYQKSLKFPSTDRLYRFPTLPVISPPGVAYKPKTSEYEPRQVMLEPGYVVHRRLHFEEKNAERAGWDFGPMQTLVSAAYFWKDTIALPHSLASGCVYGFWDTSAGKCKPGSPSPYYLYPPGLTLTGTVVEGAVITGGVFLFP